MGYRYTFVTVDDGKVLSKDFTDKWESSVHFQEHKDGSLRLPASSKYEKKYWDNFFEELAKELVKNRDTKYPISWITEDGFLGVMVGEDGRYIKTIQFDENDSGELEWTYLK